MTATFISGAPRVFNDKVAIGFGDAGTVRGAIEVYSAIDGKFLFRWTPMPVAGGVERHHLR